MRRVSRLILIMVSAAALSSLGLPSAFAAVPTITSFSPASGPAGCVVAITGTSFTNPTVSDVTFNLTAATDFTIISDTELSATVPAGATTGPISVTNPSGTATSATVFTVTSAGDCGGPSPGDSPIEVFMNTEPEICAEVDTFGTAPIMPTEVDVSATSNLVVYFTSEWSGLSTNTELLVSFRLNDGEGEVTNTPFEWGLTNNGSLTTHQSGTLMWTFDGVAPGAYDVFVDARTDPVPGPPGGGNTHNNPSAVMENCALTVFVIRAA